MTTREERAREMLAQALERNDQYASARAVRAESLKGWMVPTHVAVAALIAAFADQPLAGEDVAIGKRIANAIGRIERDHDIGIVWEHDERRAGVVAGPNALAGYPFAKAEAEHLSRLEAIALALEATASASEARLASTRSENNDGR